jgi:acyl-coenzyme A thioesterase PaaI-like protein
MTVTRLSPRTGSRAVARIEPSTLTPLQAHQLLQTKCAPWVRDLNLIVEECSVMGAKLRLPYSPRVAGVGGMVCSQALMACADAAMTVAFAALFSDFRKIATVAQTIEFMRAITIEDVIIVATIPRLGTDPVFGEITFSADGEDTIAARATATWATVALTDSTFVRSRAPAHSAEAAAVRSLNARRYRRHTD